MVVGPHRRSIPDLFQEGVWLLLFGLIALSVRDSLITQQFTAASALPIVATTPAPTASPIDAASPPATGKATSHPAVAWPTMPPAAKLAPPRGAVTIPVPVIRQTMVLDCETAALQMGLAAYGDWYGQDALFALESPDVRMPVIGPGHTVQRWGDPYTNFVGYVNGSDWTPTGYGVYYPVILSIARSHGLPNSYGGESVSAATVYGELVAGHPVEAWIETNWTRPALGTWIAWDGRAIRYSLAEHAVILSGVSPTQVRVNDPLQGTQYWVSKALFETVWADFDDMAVVFT